jgi:hypothetical protein
MVRLQLSRVRSRSLALVALALCGIALADQILEIQNATLTSVLFSGKTTVHGVRPRTEQRGVNVDGSLRSPPTFPFALAGNPYESVWRGHDTHNGVRLDTGTYNPTEIDLSLPAPGFRWTIGRSYNARQDDSGLFDSNKYQGCNWAQMSQPELVSYDPAGDTDDVIYLVYGADRYVEFQRKQSGSNDFKSKNAAAGAFVYASGSPDVWTYTDAVGTEVKFFGGNTGSNQANWQLWKITDLAGNVAYVGDSTTASTAVTNGFDSSARILKAYDSADRRYTYTYSTLDSVTRLTEVKAETKSGGTWASPTGLAEVGKVTYGYYTDESYGDVGDLKLVTVTLPRSDGDGTEIRKKYLRYWEGAYNSSTNPGHVHALKLVVDFEGARSYDIAQDGTLDDDFTSASHDNLKPYASAYFEYDGTTTHRINKAWFQGQCGCSGGATGTHEFEYETNGSYTDGNGYDTTWARRTIVKRPDNSYLTQYFDEVGQALSTVVTDIDPDTSSPTPKKWVTAITRDASGRVDQIATPASVTGYTHSSGAITLSSSAGLIRTFTRASSGDMTGFVTAQKFKTGTSGTAYFERTTAWTSFTKTLTHVIVLCNEMVSRLV